MEEANGVNVRLDIFLILLWTFCYFYFGWIGTVEE